MDLLGPPVTCAKRMTQRHLSFTYKSYSTFCTRQELRTALIIDTCHFPKAPEKPTDVVGKTFESSYRCQSLYPGLDLQVSTVQVSRARSDLA